VEVRPALAVHGRDGHREHVRRVVAGLDGLELAGRANEQPRAGEQSHRHYDLQDCRSGEQAAVRATGGCPSARHPQAILAGGANGRDQPRRDRCGERGRGAEGEQRPADRNRVGARDGALAERPQDHDQRHREGGAEHRSHDRDRPALDQHLAEEAIRPASNRQRLSGDT
jgi:hypothetical protein